MTADETDLQSTRQTLREHGQEHLLAFGRELSDQQLQSLLEQINAVDFDQLDRLIAEYVRQESPAAVPKNLQPPQIIPPDGGEQGPEARRRGEKLIAEGKVAAFVVAGGQGSRLGYEGPKGCLPATPVVKKPLFRLFAEQVRAAALRHRVTIPWYILTSPTNDTAIKAHFRQNDYWGFAPKDVMFVMQGTMPAIGMDGRLLLAAPDRLAVSPNGHGGSLTALRESGALDDMAGRGIEKISYFQVDNPLVHAIDPLFLGLADLAGAEAAAKALPKRSPDEKLGVFVEVDGKTQIIEYSDMPEELAEQTTPEGRLKFGAGSIAIHIFDRAFVERLTEGGKCRLPWHRAEKKVPCIDPETGEAVEPEQPNAVKLEMFVFDALPLAENTLLLETQREEEFSPIKNAEGPDSLPTSLHDQVRRAATWLEKAEIAVPRDAEGQVAAALEISPLFADSAEVLARKVDRHITISPGQNFYLGSRGQIGGN